MLVVEVVFMVANAAVVLADFVLVISGILVVVVKVVKVVGAVLDLFWLWL